MESVLNECKVLDSDLKDVEAEKALLKREKAAKADDEEDEDEEGWDLDESGLQPRKHERAIRGGQRRRSSDDDDEGSDLDI